MVRGSFLPVSPMLIMNAFVEVHMKTESDFNRLLGSQKIVHILTEGHVFHHVCTHMKNPD